jgi:putative ABC transport system permease protein
MNLFISQSIENKDQAAIMKVLGSNRKSIILKVVLEAILFFLISFFLALILVIIAIPWLNNFASTSINYGQIFNFNSIIIIVSSVVVIGLITAIYPSIFLSSYNLNSGFKGKSISLLRKIFVSFQFLISVSMIIISFVIAKLLNYLKNKDIGFDMKDVYLLDLNRPVKKSKILSFKSELFKYPGINAISIVNKRAIPFNFEISRDNMSVEKDTIMMDMVINFINIDNDFIDLLNMKIIAGRGFSNEYPGDSSKNVIINESLMKSMDLNNPEDAIGKKLKYINEGIIVGVIKDFNYKSLNTSLEPLVIFNNFEEEGSASVLVKTKNINNVKNLWKEYFQDIPFEYKTFTDFYHESYKKDEKTIYIIVYLTLIIVLLSCFGLFALSAYIFQLKIKEFGIRKIFGSKKRDIGILYFKTFAFPILLSFVIAIPLAYLISYRWLQDYSYRIDLNVGLFVIPIIISLFVFILVAMYFMFKTFKMNPIDTIKNQ